MTNPNLLLPLQDGNALSFIAAVLLLAIVAALITRFITYPVRRDNNKIKTGVGRDTIHLEPWEPGFDWELRKLSGRIVNQELGRIKMLRPVDVIIHGRPGDLNDQNWGARQAADFLMQNDRDCRVHFTSEDEPGNPYTRPVDDECALTYHTPSGRKMAGGGSPERN